MHVTLLYNPGAGETGDDKEDLGDIIAGAGHEVEAISLKEADLDAVLARPTDLVAVAGGDGSIGNIARRMVGRNVPIAVLPSGTANNIARTLGLVGFPKELVARWEKAAVKKFDVGIARGPWGERYFCESVGSGVFARMMAHVDAAENRDAADVLQEREGLTGYLRLLCDMVPNFEPVRWQLTLDGETIEDDYVLWEAMNISSVGPNLILSPQADPGDGFLDVVLVTASQRHMLDQFLRDQIEARTDIDKLDVRRVQRIEAVRIPGDLHLDDTSWKAGEEGALEITLLPGAVEFVLAR